MAPASVVLALLAWTAPAAAQQRPLVTEDPESIGAGLVLVEAGFDYQKDQHFPVSGLTGDLRSVPRFGVSIGVSSIAEVQIDNVSYDMLNITSRADAPLSHLLRVSGDRTSSWSDTVVGAKTRLLSEGAVRPGDRAPIRHQAAERRQRGGDRARYDGFLQLAAGRQDDPVAPRGGERRARDSERPDPRRPAERRADLRALLPPGRSRKARRSSARCTVAPIRGPARRHPGRTAPATPVSARGSRAAWSEWTPRWWPASHRGTPDWV